MKKIILNILSLFIILIGVFFIYNYLNENNVLGTLSEYYKREHSVLNQNIYGKNTQNKLVATTSDFEPTNKQDLLNIYYTVFSSGMDEFRFFCSKTYTNCIDDVKDITDDNLLLSHINNFVHPFNSYKSVRTSYTSGGKIIITVDRIYSKQKISEINNKLDELYLSLVSKDKTSRENIKSVHDYIVNNTKYDTEYINNNSIYESNSAYGPLFQGHAICSGYTDLMALFLDKMNLINHKVSNEKHVWNLVYLDGTWFHIDLTWDDPVAVNGKDYLKHDYFLITTEELEKHDVKDNITEHYFDKTIYLH